MMLFLLICGSATLVLIGAIVGRAYERNVWQRRLLMRSGMLVGDQALNTLRLPNANDPQRVSEALDAMAIEIERIGEGQRFLTTLLADQARSAAIIG